MPHPVDIHVGAEIARRRLALGLNQSDIGRALGLTFQQVQKYEKGSNRVSASKLSMLATTLNCAVGDFFPDSTPTEASAQAHVSFFSLRGATALAKAYEALTPAQRKLVVSLATEMIPPAPEADGTGFDYLDDQRDEALNDRLAGDLHA